MPGASSLGEEGEDGGSRPPNPPFRVGFPGTIRWAFFPRGPGLGNRAARFRARCPRRESGLSPLLRLRRSGPPRLRRACSRRSRDGFSKLSPRFPGEALGTLAGFREAPPGGRDDRLPGPRAPPPFPPGIPASLTPSGLRSALPSGGRASSARRPLPASRTLPPDARPESRTEAAVVTGQRRGARSWAGRLGGLFLSLPPPLFLLPPC